jgi:ComF family protein
MRELWYSLLHLFFPKTCFGCGIALSVTENVLCVSCASLLPSTRFGDHPDNLLEKSFNGRINLVHTTAAYFFTRPSLLQSLVHAFKYSKRRDIALFLGRQMGLTLQLTQWVHETDVIVPVPLSPSRQKERGYNQAALLAEGIASVIHKPVLAKALKRRDEKGSQTTKNRELRAEAVMRAFSLNDPESIRNKHILLVDDVITTGATIEACYHTLNTENVQVSVCGLAYVYR